MLLQIDGTSIVIAVSFIVFVIIMQKIFYAPITEVRQERSDYISNNNKIAGQKIEESEQLIKDYETKIAQTKIQSAKLVSQLTDEANQKKLSRLAEKSQQVNAQLNAKREELEKEKNNAVEALKPQIINLASFISSKILGEEIPVSGISREIIDKAVGCYHDN